jgi:septum formation protein
MQLLRQPAVKFKVQPADIDETPEHAEAPRQYVQRMALEKARAGFQQCGRTNVTLGSDTIVVLNEEILGKPASRAEAETMLGNLSGQTHQVYSAVALVLESGEEMETLNITAVTFGDMSSAWIKHYCQSEEPMDKAGAYAVQGGAGQYIRRIEGSYSGVMGLPLYETALLLRQAGLLI